MITHQFEPELNLPTPRQVRYRNGFATGCGMWSIRLFLLPHTIVGIGALCVALWSTGVYVAVGLFGTNYEGRIVKKDESRSSKGVKHYYMKYTFTVDRQPYSEDVPVSQERFAEIHEGDAITVRALESAPDTGQWPRIPGHWPIQELGGKWFFALFWNGVMSIFVWQMYVVPYRQCGLVRWGQPTEGIIRNKTKQVNKGTKSYRLTYEFAAPAADGSKGQVLTGKMTTTLTEAANAHEGQLVTVLYHPDKPWRNTLYAYSCYRAAIVP